MQFSDSTQRRIPAEPVDSDEDEIPPFPPAPLRNRYLRVSWHYVFWCCGMLLWTLLCIAYFIITRQRLELGIGICLGVLLIAMIVLPTVLFGGRTWYKRLGWMTILLGLFTVMWIYPLIMIVLGVSQRIRDHSYSGHVIYTNYWHLALSVMTIVLTGWTIAVTVDAARLVRILSRGDWNSEPLAAKK